MENSIKKLILREGSKSQVLLTKKRMKTFQFCADEVEATVVGKLIGEVVYFRVVGEDILYALKGDRFYTVEDTTIWQEEPAITPKTPKKVTETPQKNTQTPKSLPEAIPVAKAKEDTPESLDRTGGSFGQLRPTNNAGGFNPPSDGQLMVIQLDYHGNPEELPKSMYKNLVVCQCGQPRWVKNSDLFQVRFCKPCTMINRKQMSKERRCTK